MARRSPVSGAQARWLRTRLARLAVVDHVLLWARWASLRRMAPLSKWGFERGTPVDRWYIERFLELHRGQVSGRVLEVLDDRYATRLGADQVDILDIDPSNRDATIVGDVCDEATLSDSCFDAIILTQTLQLVPDPAKAVENLLAALRPGGSLLITVPAVSRIASALDRWRWTPLGLRELVTSTHCRATVTSAGNLLACRAFLMGLAAEDLPDGVLSTHDPDFPLVVLARLDKTEQLLPAFPRP